MLTHNSATDAKKPCCLSLSKGTLEYLFVRFGELSPRVSLPTTLAHHVGGVISSRAHEKMFRIEARRVVAMVQNQERRCKIEPEPQVSGKAVNADASVRVKRSLAVAFTLRGFRPVPTTSSINSAVVQQPPYNLIFGRPSHKTVTTVVYLGTSGVPRAVTIFGKTSEVHS